MPRKISSDHRSIPSRLAIIVASEKGGVWKTSLVSRAVPFLEAAGCKVCIVQVDQQPRLEAMFPGQVTSIPMPDAAALREDDTADTKALLPLYDVLVDPQAEITIVDVGANLDERASSFMIGVELHQALLVAGAAMIGFVPMRPEDEAVRLGCRTMRRLGIAMPQARLVPVLCTDAQGSFTTLGDEAQAEFDAAVGPHLAAGEVLRFPRLAPTALQALGRSGLSAHAFANLSPEALVAKTALHPALARQVQGDVITHVADIEMEFARILGSFRGAGDADHGLAS